MRRRDQGSALVIATIMLVVLFAMIGVLLGAPQAQLTRVQSTILKERSVAAAQSGVADALAWCNANGSKAYTALGTTSGWISGTLGTPTQPAIPTSPAAVAAQAAATLTPTLVGANGSAITVASLTRYAGTTQFPVFASSNYVSFGDPIANHGQYAWSIIYLGNNFFQVDSEGRVATIGNSTTSATALNYVTTRIRTIVQIPQPSTSTLAPTMIVPQNRTTPPAFGTAPATLANNGPGYFSNGYDNATSALTNSGLVLPGAGLFAVPGGAVNGAVPPIQTSPSTATGSFVDQIVAAAVADAALPPASQPANFYSAAVDATGTFSGSIAPKMANGTVTYVKIAPNATTVPQLANYRGAPGSTGGIFIIDVGDNATFNAGTGLFDWGGNHFYEGAVIIYQRGRINLGGSPANTFNLADSNGVGSRKPNGLFQYNSQFISDALNILNVTATPKIASSVILE